MTSAAACKGSAALWVGACRRQRAQQLQRGIAIGHQSLALLVLAQPGARGGAQNAVGVPVSKPLAFSAACSCRVCSRDRGCRSRGHRPPRRGRRSGVATTAPRPGRSWWNCCSAGWCGSLPHQKCRAPCTGGRQDGGRGQVGQGVAVHGAHPFSSPLGSALPHAQLSPGVVKARW